MLQFDPIKHRYTDNEGNIYSSMTSVLAHYEEPYNGDYWSSYRAIKFITIGLQDEKNKELAQDALNIINNYPQSAYQEIKLSMLACNYINCFTTQHFTLQHNILFITLKRKILEAWKTNSENSTIIGTDFHQTQEDLETEIYQGVEYKKEDWVFDYETRQFNFRPGYMYCEVRLCDKDTLISGSTDKVMCIAPNQLIVRDYKSNKVMKPAFMNKNLYPPLQNYKASSVDKYSIQLNGYGYMLEKLGYEVTGMNIEHFRRDKKNEFIAEPIIYPVTKDMALMKTLFEDYHSKRVSF